MNDWRFFLLAALAGLCAGSFLNVVIVRLPQMILHPQPNFTLWLPHSHCPHCRQQLRWRDNIPLLSWLMLRGRCRGCQHAISHRYPLVECAAMLLVLLMTTLTTLPFTLLALCFFSLSLLALSLIDAEHQLLPDALTQPLLWTGLLFSLHSEALLNAQQALSGAICGFSVMATLRAVFSWLRREEALGYGDVKLTAALGAWLGWVALPHLLLIAAAGALLYSLLSGRGCQQTLAFGPFLAAAGGILMLLTQY